MDTIRATRNGDARIFDKKVWDNMPDDKHGWKQAAEVPEEVLKLQNASENPDSDPSLTLRKVVIPVFSDVPLYLEPKELSEQDIPLTFQAEINITGSDATGAADYTSPYADQDSGSVQPSIPSEQNKPEVPPASSDAAAEAVTKPDTTSAVNENKTGEAVKAPVKKSKNAQADK